MNLFGIDITLSKKDENGKYVKQKECHQAQDSIKNIIEKALIRIHSDTLEIKKEIKEDFNIRIDDLKTNIETIKDFLLKK